MNNTFDNERAEFDGGNNSIVSENSMPTPGALDAHRLAMRTAKRTADSDKALAHLRAICYDWKKNGYIRNASLYLKDGNDLGVAVILQQKLRDLGWVEGTHYTLTPMSDNRGYAITFRTEYTSFNP